MFLKRRKEHLAKFGGSFPLLHLPPRNQSSQKVYSPLGIFQQGTTRKGRSYFLKKWLIKKKWKKNTTYKFSNLLLKN
jgi:hypothetical protein